MSGSLENAAERIVDAIPLGVQLLEHRAAGGREPVEALVAAIGLAPFALEQSLRLEAPQQGIERALVDVEATLRKGLAQRVAVLLRTQGGQRREHQAPAAKLHAKRLEDLVG